MLDIEKILAEEKPFLGEHTIRMIGQIITRKTSVLEFGGGGSTIWFARRAKRVLTIEGNITFAIAIIKKLNQEKLKNTEVRYSPKYTLFHLMVPPNTFDLVLLDGRKRLACARLAVNSLKPNGWIVLDNSEAVKNKTCVEYLGSLGWKKWETSGYKLTSNATFWKKPKEKKQ